MLNYTETHHIKYQNMIIYSIRAHMRRAVASGGPSAEIWGGGQTDDLVEVLIRDSTYTS